MHKENRPIFLGMLFIHNLFADGVVFSPEISMNKSVAHRKTRSRIHGGTPRFKKYAFLLLLGAVVVSLAAATANVAGAANATQPSVGATTHPIQYWIGCAPSMVTATNLNYFKQQGFTAVCVVVPDSQTYATQLNTIKSLNMLPIIDIEMPIWDGGQLQSTPISNFASYFKSLETAGWQYVASEGGRPGDLAYMQNYFKGYVNFNCDQCGLWQNRGIRCIQTHSRSRTAGRATTHLSGRPSKLDQSRPLRLASRTASSLAPGLIAAATTRYTPTQLAAAVHHIFQC